MTQAGVETASDYVLRDLVSPLPHPLGDSGDRYIGIGQGKEK